MKCTIPSLLGFLLLLQISGAAEPGKNFFTNPGFELGRESWQPAKAGKTECTFTVDGKDVAEGQQSALLSLDAVESWGVQFGQSFSAGQKAKTYTFAVFAKSLCGPVQVGLEIERTAKPWDRAAGKKFQLSSEWQELHFTFTLDKDFSEGWFAYISCAQAKSKFRVDMFRLYEGDYVPYKQAAQQEIAGVSVRLFDTGAASSTPLNGEALTKRAGWTEVPEDKLDHTFKGDAVLVNDRIALVLRKGARGVEAYATSPQSLTLRAVLAPEAEPCTMSSFKLTENNPGAASAEVEFAGTDGKNRSLRYELQMGQPVVQIETKKNAASLRVEAPCRFAVMPDFFADDIVIDAAQLPVTKADLPSDNFLLHLLPDQQAIVMTIVKTSEQDIQATLSGEGPDRRIETSEIAFGKDGKIWTAILASPKIWYQQEIKREQAGQIVRLDWERPFPAQWRIDWRGAEDLTDSWDMLAEKTDGTYLKNNIYGGPESIPSNRRRWTTVLGTFSYPAWIDKAGRGYVQPLKSSAVRFQGPAVIYPLNRIGATALDTFTVVDIVRNTLGVGPCEYVLDLENQQSKYKGRATCSTRDTLNPIYEKNQQKQERAQIEKVLEDVMIFIRHIRGRIESYVEFGHKTLAYLETQKKAHPELAPRIAELESLARIIDSKYAARQKAIKTPEVAAAMVEDFRKTLLDYGGQDGLAKCRKFTEGWVDIGGNQDELAGECRWAVKNLRQKAALLLARDPRMGEIAKEIRQRSQEVLRNPAGHEGARH